VQAATVTRRREHADRAPRPRLVPRPAPGRCPRASARVWTLPGV